MKPALSIRDAHDGDLAAVASLYEASGVDPQGRNDAATIAAAWQRLRREAPTARVLLAEDGGTPVGTLTCFVLPLLVHGGTPAALVEAVAVHPQAQGHGVGRALMDAAMAIAREAGCYKLALSSNQTRTNAHAFYDRLGYARHGVSFVAYPEESAA
jgi:GNAT superfamily N-acetyltransferase